MSVVTVSIRHVSTVTPAAHAALTAAPPEQAVSPDTEALGTLPRRAIAGEANAIDDLMVEIRPRIVRYCRARLGRDAGHYDLADDVAQEVCVAVISALDNYRDMGRPFMAFVYGIAAHKVADARRRESRSPSLTVQNFPDDPDEAPGPEEWVLRVSDARKVRALLERLPKQQRDLLLLRVVVGLSSEETGKALNMRAAAVRVQQHRSLRRLRELAEEAGIT